MNQGVTSGTRARERREHEREDDEGAETANHCLEQHTGAAAVAAVLATASKPVRWTGSPATLYAGNGRARRLGGFGVLAEARGRSRTG